MPEQPAEGTQTWTVRVPASLSLRVKAQARRQGISLNAWVLRAAERELGRGKLGVQITVPASERGTTIDPADFLSGEV